mmetsp:Transcript_65510/g.76993  ORF Transcript_65510/g.76993 Transcript_65510/m.76993 type:complete len:816 (+) Transcript_65510:112-2559(+)
MIWHSAALALLSPTLPSLSVNADKISNTIAEVHPFLSRNLSPDELTGNCDSQFFSCMSDKPCNTCFTTLNNENIDWTRLASEKLECGPILALLQQESYCMEIGETKESKDNFCLTLLLCSGITFDNDYVEPPYSPIDFSDEIDEYDYDYDDDEAEDEIDDFVFDPSICANLTVCDWQGMHGSFLGDGTCNMEMCYNTEVCGFDGGDCCADTCHSAADYIPCGIDGYQCSDPNSKYFPTSSDNNDSDKDHDNSMAMPCAKDQQKYKIMKYDSWGDGWDGSQLRITDTSTSNLRDNKELYSVTLEKGKEGHEHVCLKNGCFTAVIDGGMWGNEISWEIRQDHGGPLLASGGAPTKCTFPLGSNACENTCNYIPSTYEESIFGKMSECMTDRCFLQLNSCNNDKDCTACQANGKQSFCAENAIYRAIVDCSVCSCAEDRPSFCDEKTEMEPLDEEDENANGNSAAVITACNSEQTASCTSAAQDYTSCSDVNPIDIMGVRWDENNFGTLDVFEACAHAYAAGDRNYSALDCLSKLVGIFDKSKGYNRKHHRDSQTVRHIAWKIYVIPEVICECTSKAAQECPLCSKFSNFKTVLRETLDACLALDEIDCPSWAEFSEPCQANMNEKFGVVDFHKLDQCEYIREGCGGVGPFPTFRKLDCKLEISKKAFNMYNSYHEGCVDDLKLEPVVPWPVEPPTSNKPMKPMEIIPAPTNNGIPPSQTPKAYIAPESHSETNKFTVEDNSSSEKSGHKVLIGFFCISFIAGSFVLYRKRQQSKPDYFAQYHMQRANRRPPTFDENYSNIGNFEAVTLKSGLTNEMM